MIYYNQPIQDVYPDLKENGNAIVKNLIAMGKEEKVVKIGEKVYKPEYRVLNNNGKYRGHIITVSDITVSDITVSDITVSDITVSDITVSDITDNYNYTQLMKKMTEIDSLTGLLNRFAYEYRISEMRKNGKWSDKLLLFVMDLMV